jgi:hypothetical protein
MTAITRRTAQAATFAACSPRIQEAPAEAGPPPLESGHDTPTREGRSPRRRPGGSARPARTRTTSGSSLHSQDGARGDRVHRRSAAGPPPSAMSGCTTHLASASTRPGAPVHIPRARGRAAPIRAASVRVDCPGRLGQGPPRQRKRRRSSESCADRHQTPRGWLQILAAGRRARWQRSQPDRRRQLGTSQPLGRLPSVPLHPSVASRSHRTRWQTFTGRIAERVDG